MTEPSPSRGLIDTNVVIDLSMIRAPALPDLLRVSAITLGEGSAAPHYVTDLAERARRTALLQQVEAAFDPLPFDASAARAYGRVWAATLQAGRHSRRRVADLMIAAVALSNALPLHTSKPKDFVGLEGLLDVRPVNHP